MKNVVLENLRFIPFDTKLQQAVQKRSLLMDVHSASTAAESIKKLSDRLEKSPIKESSKGALTFFMNKVVEGVN